MSLYCLTVDISGAFDNIVHSQALFSLASSVVNPSVLCLLSSWSIFITRVWIIRTGKTSLVVSKNPPVSGFSNLFVLESEAKGLESEKTRLKSRLQSKKHRKLERHQRSHTEKKTYKCDVCEKIFSQRGHLNTHQRVHTGEKPFNCHVFDKTFSQAASLNRHQRLHSSEKLFKCHVCDKIFSEPTKLKLHQRVHTDEKLFKCDVCEKTFSDEGNFKQHQRVHKREKPFKCDVWCVPKAHLGTHQKVHACEYHMHII
ncbi:zinc finger protein 28-like [Artemia franciscana]|uniref:zinc finger protein 28-like n=1 Tax=Artemia franciscana TaxID=6661 RepID=UPI0032D9F08A